MSDLAAQTLLSAPVLFFALGLFAMLVRSDLQLPEAVSKGLSLYLVAAIGFKGGAGMAADASWSVLGIVIAGVALSAIMPLIGFASLRATTRLAREDAAAIAAHYGSISIVTFIAAKDALSALGVETGGYMVAVAAAMEAPAILTGLVLAHGLSRNARRPAPLSAGVTPTDDAPSSSLAHCFTNGSIVLLLGSFAIGWATGDQGMAAVSPFFVDIFRGLLCLFLLDMGLTAGRGLFRSGSLMPLPMWIHGLYMPLIGAALGLATARFLGLDVGDTALLITLSASASYIAVPAALKLVLPKVDLARPLALSLGVTFPFNILLGIPLYIAVAQATAG